MASFLLQTWQRQLGEWLQLLKDASHQLYKWSRCEVQFDYGLRQKRSRPIASRPKTFRSAQGKEISVKETVAVKNDEITKQGKVRVKLFRTTEFYKTIQAIHKELEREIRLEELQVDISSHEERWALRYGNYHHTHLAPTSRLKTFPPSALSTCWYV